MDVERMVAQRLMDETGIKAVLDVPADRPSEFISVSQTGSSRSGCINRVQLVAQSWAKTADAPQRSPKPWSTQCRVSWTRSACSRPRAETRTAGTTRTAASADTRPT